MKTKIHLKEYIFLTPDGQTTSPKNDEINNLQVLGTAFGANGKTALSNLLKENEYLKKAGFKELIVYELGSNANYMLSMPN